MTCPYCSVELTEENNSEEHVVGRKFVPKGTLNNNWNLIVRSCNECNEEKSNFEDDISAITLAGRVWFEDNEYDETLLNNIKRKAKGSYSRRTRKAIF